MDTDLLRTELPNVAEGSERVSVADLGSASRFVVLLLMQSAGSGTCRQQARDIAADYEAFRQREAAVAVIVPGTIPKVRAWRRLVDPPFPVLADREATLADSFDQRTQYGRLGRFVASISRPPVAVVLDYRGDSPAIAYRYEGSTSFDRPTSDDLRAAIDEPSA